MKFLKSRTFIVDAAVVAIGILSGIGVFAVIQSVNHKNEVKSLIPRAQEAYKSKQYSTAINLYQKAEAEFPEDLDIKRNLIDLYFTKGKYDEALKFLEKIPSTSRTNSDYEKAGEIYFEKNDFDKVIQNWEGKSLKPYNTYKLSQIFYSKDQLDKYILELSKIKNTYEGLLLTQVKETDLNQILSNIEEVITLQKVSSDSYNISSFKSQIENAKNQKDFAKDDFSELIQVSAFTELNQCKFLYERIANLRSVLDSKKIPTFQVDYYEGVCANQINNPDKAIPLLEKAIQSDTTIIEYREALAKSYFLKKDVDNLKKTYDDIFVIKKSPQLLINFAYYLYKLEKFDEALANYNEALSITESAEEKKELSINIFQIGLLNKKDLELCKRTEILENIKTINSVESRIISGHCLLYSNGGLVESANDYIGEYFLSLKEKDEAKVVNALDKDMEGILTSYYKAVGVKILE